MRRPFKENPDLGLLVLRVGLGFAFFMHGVMKMQSMTIIVGFFRTLHLSAPWAYLVTAVETLGGLALLAGVLAEWGAALIAVDMLAAFVLLRYRSGYLGGYELEAMYFFAALAVLFAGPGKYRLRPPMRQARQPRP